jgi:hypothetical protein
VLGAGGVLTGGAVLGASVGGGLCAGAGGDANVFAGAEYVGVYAGVLLTGICTDFGVLRGTAGP